MQTGASALLAAASVTTLYGLIRFFDLFRREPMLVAEPQRIDFTPDGEADVLTVNHVAATEPTVKELVDALALDPRLTDFGETGPEAAPVERIAVLADEVSPAKAPRKGSRRAANSQTKAKSAKPELLVEAPVEAPTAVFVEEVTHTHVAPLFEPDPFHRIPRQGFGRRGRI